MKIGKAALKNVGFSAIGIIGCTVLRSLSVYCFIVPNNFAPGGFTGIAAMLEFGTGFSSGYYLWIMNIPLLIISFFLLSKPFAVKSAIATTLTSGALVLLQALGMPQYTESAVLAAVAGGILGGAALACMLKVGGSSGGTDIIAMFIQRKHTETNVSWFIFMLDAVVVVVSVFIYGNLTAGLLALTEMFVSAKVSEMIMHGLKAAQKFEIITNHPDELSKELLEILRRGVTMVPAVGMYSHESKALIICVVRKRQITEFRKILKKYPDTFAYMTSTSEVMGRGFNS